MSYLERLDEALRRLDVTTDVVRFAWDDGFDPIVDAARAYRDLLANGERVEWCEMHRSACHLPNPLTEERCDVWVAAQLDGWDVAEPCRIVSKLLVDHPTEEEER